MSWSRIAVQAVAAASRLSGHRRFRRALRDVESVQRGKLAGYLRAATGTEYAQSRGLDPRWSFEQFRERVPLTEYQDWEPWIAKQREAPDRPVLARSRAHFEPTSGSTAKRKWIPYTPELRKELDAAAAAWLLDLYLQDPRLLGGRHYWSLSWLPDDLRKEPRAGNDDLRLLPWWTAQLLRRVMAVPAEVGLLPTVDASLVATLAYLAACEDLALLSVWSPTFALELLRLLAERREAVAAVLESGRWEALGGAVMASGAPPPRSARAARLLREARGPVGPELTRRLWPNLVLLSAWDSSTSALWAAELRRSFPACRFQGKGLWATEGVVTIPFSGRYPLAVTSHFLEFRDLETGRIFPAWQLEAGQQLQPVLTTGGGLWRYLLQDRVEVTGFLESCPCLRFLGREGVVDLVGEKLSSQDAAVVLERLSSLTSIRCVSVRAESPPDVRPRYVVLAEGPPERADEIALQFETLLREFHHYALARELGQLAPAGAILRWDALTAPWGRGPLPGSGSRKIEPLVVAGRDL